MKRLVPSLAVLAYLGSVVLGNEVKLTQADSNSQRCSGMYDKKSWGGSVNPFISVKYLEQKNIPENEDPISSLIIFEWHDEDLIGHLPPDAQSLRDLETICDADNVQAGYCKQEDLGAFILKPNATDVASFTITNQAIHLKDSKPIQYPIRKTGYYCVATFPFSNHPYTAVVEFRNAYGELPAAQIAKLPFYGGLTIVYAVLGIFWGFLYVQNRSDILPVQNYITATIAFLVVEQLMTWGFYDYQNRHGNDALNKIFMVVVSILNAGRNALSFFLLLIVCMGYGVVKESLGRTMLYVKILAVIYFVLGVVYATTSLAVTPDTVGPIVLFVVMPLAATLVAFYVWTLSSLNITMKDLLDRKQKVKAMMYKKLWWCILGSIMVIFAFFFLNSLAFAGTSRADFVPEHWQTRWFVLDGWLNLVYLFDFAFIAYLWRPTVNNRRFAMSDELAQDDDGFEIRSMADSLDDDLREDRDPESNPSTTRNKYDADRAVSPSAGPGTGAATSLTASLGQQSAATSSNKDTAAPPSYKPPKPRESLDAETIFAVGDDGIEWSEGEADDSDDADEGRKLTRKISPP